MVLASKPWGSFHGEPEVIWLSAHAGREALGRVLGRAVEHGWLDEAEARRIGAGVLGANTRRLHGIGAAA